MPDIDFATWLALPAGSAALYFCVKVLWPRLMAATEGNLVDQRANTALVQNLISERDKALARADAADARADTMFKELAEVKSQLQVMTYQLQSVQASNAYLKRRLNELIGGDDVPDDPEN